MSSRVIEVGEELTAREIEALQAKADHGLTKAAAEVLEISEQTVKSHLTTIYAKLGLDNETQAVAEGFRRGLLR